MLRQPIEFTQYVSIWYSERLAEAGIEPCVGNKGDSYDNRVSRDHQRAVQGRIDSPQSTLEDQGITGAGHA